ncbi:MAG: alanine--tRNA ligase, partial [Planctomycetaceae bacterium]|nr:alanine--tRNA ligase [Planctomycetaceae bacterium]
QKCLRTGDIDNVGRTAYHHTFFEMLGNFSFGDYFKREAIFWAWEFLTDKKWLGIDPAKLSATVYKDDHEAAKIWLDEIGLPESRLQYLDEDENFWPASAPSQGPDGVCGPCSEIYHDTPNGPVEIWNLVFTQFNRVGEPPDNLRPLPSKNIDTGMGLERCAAVLQGVDTNYHIDILRPLVEAAAEVLGIKYDAASDNGRRLRRIADHIRACAFAVHENVYPGNKEEKYVIRRLLRRAVLDGRQMGHRDSFLHLLVPKVAEMMKVPYPELSETTTRVAKVIETEEEHFIGTVDSGLEKIERIFAAMLEKTADGSRDAAAPLASAANCRLPSAVSGTDIFDMYQTFGFPPELFETLASERGFSFDWAGFNREMERHGEISGSTEKNLLFKDDPLAEIKKTHKTEFVGYDSEVCAAEVIAILADGKLVETAPEGQTAQIVLDKTPFYGEKGGQVGDKGIITMGQKRGHCYTTFCVEDTQIDGDLIVHFGHLETSEETKHLNKTVLKVGDKVYPGLDENRGAIQRAHTATHILHRILRQKLGTHAEQQGSKVDADILRFDFTHHQAIDRETLFQIERKVNAWVFEGFLVSSCEMDINDARKTGAMMLFGEKYPEKVRVVTVDGDGGDSIELCGGTHVKNTSEIGLFKIISESSVAAGIRRIEAITGQKAVEKVLADSAILQQVAQTLKIPAEEIPAKVEAMTEQIKTLRKTADGRRQTAAVNVDDLIANAETVGDVKVILRDIPDTNIDGLRQLVDQIRTKTAVKSESIAMLFSSVQGDKVTLVAGLSKDLVEKKLDAIEWLKSVSPIVGGKGAGGRPDLAQGGGKDKTKLPELFTAAKKFFRQD